MEKGHGASMPSLSVPLSSNLHVFMNLETLQTQSFWVSTEASLNQLILLIDLMSSPSHLLGSQGMGLKVLTLYLWLVLLITSTQFLGASQN